MIDEEIVARQEQIKLLQDELAIRCKELHKDPRCTALKHLIYAAELMGKKSCFVPHDFLNMVKALKLSYTFSAEDIMIHLPAHLPPPLCHDCAKQSGG